MSVNTKMTAIADEIRVLSGTTETMGLDAMATNVGNANDEIAEQAALIEQIAAGLVGKMGSGSGGSGTGSVEACTVTLQCYESGSWGGAEADGVYVYCIGTDGELKCINAIDYVTSWMQSEIQISKGSILYMEGWGWSSAYCSPLGGDVTALRTAINYTNCFYVYGDCTIPYY